MLGFFKKNYELKEVPEWASIYNLGDFNLLVSYIKQNFHNKSVDIDIDKGIMEVPEVFKSGYQLGLTNLANICFHINKRHWKRTIKEHFDNLLKGYSFEKELNKIINDYSAVSKYIAIRIWPKSHVEGSNNEKIIYRENIEDLVTTLVFDLPTTVRSISIDETKEWNKPLDQLFEIGNRNVVNNYSVNVCTEEIEEKPCYFLTGDHFFVASYAFLLHKYPECIGKYGTIVGFPHRHVIIAYPINGDDIVTVIKNLMIITSGMYKEGPGSISPNLYWFIDGKYTKLPYEIEDEDISFYPPDSYINMLEKIMEDKNR